MSKSLITNFIQLKKQLKKLTYESIAYILMYILSESDNRKKIAPRYTNFNVDQKTQAERVVED